MASPAHAQTASTDASCLTRGSSLQDFLNQDLTTVEAVCRKELDDALASSSPTSCFTDPVSTAPGVASPAGGMNAASQAQAAAYKSTDTQNQTQKNYCYLHLNRINASCGADEAKLATKALNDYADCSQARSLAAQALAAQSGAVADASAAKPAYQQTAGLSGVLMACYLGVCALQGGMDQVKATLDPTQELGHSLTDAELSEATQPRPRSPASASGSP